MVGTIYLWETGYPRAFREQINRYYKVLSVTLTHVYIRNVRLGSSKNVPIWVFEQEYLKITEGEVIIYE